jgi:plastocyanin domain-containing protein
MIVKKIMISSIVSFGIVLGVCSGEVFAQVNHEVSSENSQTTVFRHIEQPVGVKGAVTASTVALIGLELWWFLWSKPKTQKGQAIAQKGYSRKE